MKMKLKIKIKTKHFYYETENVTLRKEVVLVHKKTSGYKKSIPMLLPEYSY